MPIKLKLIFEEGWRKAENERFGDALVVKFVDVDTKNVLFSYAPRLSDIDFWNLVFGVLPKYDSYLKKVKDRAEGKDGCSNS